MQWLLRILTLIALIAAPIASPAAAMAPAQAATADCKQMDMGARQHQMPAGHRSGEPCCTAVPPAIDPSLTAVAVPPPVDHPTFIAVTEPFRLGSGPKAEDPPPRLA
ncbi:MAG: hypothetical protein ABIW03_04695 [Sphingomicrobium sp.]